MMMSNIFIANPELRAKFRKQLDAAGTSQLGVMGLVACETAYNKGEEWYEAMLSYVKANAEFTRQYVEEQIPGVKMIDLEEHISYGSISARQGFLSTNWKT